MVLENDENVFSSYWGKTFFFSFSIFQYEEKTKPSTNKKRSMKTKIKRNPIRRKNDRPVRKRSLSETQYERKTKPQYEQKTKSQYEKKTIGKTSRTFFFSNGLPQYYKKTFPSFSRTTKWNICIYTHYGYVHQANPCMHAAMLGIGSLLFANCYIFF